MVLKPELNVSRLEFGELESVFALVEILADLLDEEMVRIGLDREVVLENGHFAYRVDEHSISTVAVAVSAAAFAARAFVRVRARFRVSGC